MARMDHGFTEVWIGFIVECFYVIGIISNLKHFLGSKLNGLWEGIPVVFRFIRDEQRIETAYFLLDLIRTDLKFFNLNSIR